MNALIVKYWPLISTYLSFIVLLLFLVNLASRRIPDKKMKEWEKSRPRLANLLRFFRAAGTDIDKACRALWCVLTGKPWPALLDTLSPPPTPKPEDPPSPPN